MKDLKKGNHTDKQNTRPGVNERRGKEKSARINPNVKHGALGRSKRPALGQPQYDTKEVAPVIPPKCITVTGTQFLAAQKKAFKIWSNIVQKEGSSLYGNGVYVAKAAHPQVYYYAVSRSNNLHNINAATGMFRFSNEACAEEFIARMGTDIKYLFPSYEEKR